MSTPSAMRDRSWLRFTVIAAVLSFTLLQPVLASSVVPMTLERMADHAGQVLKGEVVSVRSYWADNPRRIESEVTFESVEYLKGALPDSSSTFTLTVPGGTVGQTQMRLCCAPTFRKGERWILFVLPTYKTFPVVGLYQGAYRIVKDEAGVDRIQSAGRASVCGIDDTGFVQLPSKHVCSVQERLVSQNGIRVNASPRTDASLNGAMRCDTFLDQLRPILAASKRHMLSAPAGQRVLVHYRPVSLKLAERGQTKPSAKIVRDGQGTVRKAEKAKRAKVQTRQNTGSDRDASSANTASDDSRSSNAAAESNAQEVRS